MASAISVPYAIDQHDNACGISEENAPGRPTAHVTFTCFASQHYQLIKDLMGYPIAAGSTIIRTYPFQYPPSPNLICTAIEGVEFFGTPTFVPGVGAPWVWRNLCRVKARFELPTFYNNSNDPSGLPYTTTTFQGVSDGITIPDSSYTFPSGWPTSFPLMARFPKVQITMLRHMMPFAPVPQAFPLLGAVNNAPILIGGYSCPTGSLLFTGFSCSPSADPTGAIYYDVQYTFEYRERPWNQFPSPNPTEGWAVPTDGLGNTVFPAGNFASLP